MAGITAVSVVLAAGILSSAYAGQDAPNVTADSVGGERDNSFEWDFGTEPAGKKMRHDFVFRNTSGKLINIQDVTSSCGCAVSEVKNKTVPPGGETIISVEFDSTGYSGHIQQFVYVSTDDADNPILRYTIKVFLSPAV
jgi:hypothetical protein